MVYVKNAQKISKKIVKKNVWLYTNYIGLQYRYQKIEGGSFHESGK